MDDEMGSATDIYSLLVFSGLSTPNFTLIGNEDFLAVIRIVGLKSYHNW